MTKQPNILFILMDDMGWKDLSCMGSEFYETPNIDSLAKRGMVFTDAYAACPVCSPTRASLMSGKYPARVGVTDWIDHSNPPCHPLRGILEDAPYIKQLPLCETSVASALADGGYQTWHVGKWHLGKEEFFPDKHGFQRNIGGYHYGNPPAGYFAPWKIPTLEEGNDGELLTDALTTKAIELIGERQKDHPFFLNMWYYAVHTPIQAKAEKIAKYEAKAKALGLDKINPFVIGEEFKTEDKKGKYLCHRIVQSNCAYAAMIESVDENVGRLIEKLAQEGLTDDTIVIFTSDNGGLATSETSPTCNYPLSDGKGWMYEGGTREPLLVVYPPMIEAGSSCAVPVTSPDFYPTLLDLANLPLRPEQHCDGISLVPLFKGKEALDREAIYWHYPHYGNQGGTPGSSVRSGEWKLIEFFETGKLELYNLKQDISEENDLSKQEPEIVKHLHQLLKDWRIDVSAKLPKRLMRNS